MVIYLDEDRAYLSWTGHHREGFVLDALRRPTRKQPVLHRATCVEIHTSTTRRTHWTTGRRLKACSQTNDELVAWCDAEYGQTPAECPTCLPCSTAQTGASPTAEEAPPTLTHLGKEIVDLVVETAVIQLDHEQVQYNLTIGELAASLDKTPGQLRNTLVRLVEDGYLQVEGVLTPGRALPKKRRVYPTATALRTLPAFEVMSGVEMEEELERLRGM